MITDEAVEAAARSFASLSRWEDVSELHKSILLLNARRALEAAAPHMLAELREARETLARVEKVRQELFDLSNDDDWPAHLRAAYRDASRAIYTATKPDVTSTEI